MLDDVYKVVAGCPVQAKVTVAGYTDNAGDPTANLLISKAQAQAAADRLVAHGLNANRVIVQGFGSASPVADNDTADGRLQNRRVVIQVNGG